MTKQHEGCLAVGQLAQSLKERFRLHRTLLGVLVAKAGAAEDRAKQNELPGMADAQASGEKAAVQARVGTPERGELTFAHVQVEPDLAGSIHETAQSCADGGVVAG